MHPRLTRRVLVCIYYQLYIKHVSLHSKFPWCVSMHIFMYVCVIVFVYAYACIYDSVCTCGFVNMFIHMHIYGLTNVHA